MTQTKDHTMYPQRQTATTTKVLPRDRIPLRPHRPRVQGHKRQIGVIHDGMGDDVALAIV